MAKSNSRSACRHTQQNSLHRFMLSTRSRLSSFSFRSRWFYKLKIDRDKNKCLDKDMTENLDKFQSKLMNKYCRTPLLLDCRKPDGRICECLSICGPTMCADSTIPFYLAVSRRLACGGWGKRYWSWYYYHPPWQLLRLQMYSADGT